MNKKPMIIFHEDKISHFDQPVLLIGGKALGLHKLAASKVNVPAWFTLTTNAYAESTAGVFSDIPAKYNEKDLPVLTARITGGIKEIRFPASVESAVRDAWQKIQKKLAQPVAVRSSAVDEDAKNLSFAGQMESFLNITNEHELFSAIKECWASAFSERAVAYRLENNLNPLKVKVAVVVQCMIDARLSGVLFTADPVSGDRDKMVVSALWGLGEGLVSRGLNADNYILAKDGEIISKEISHKTSKIISKPGGGVSEENISALECDKESLSEEQLIKLVQIGKKLEKDFGFPLDIEFCYDEKGIYVLQARPITTLVEKTGRIIWDNSNIIESYSGVTTPLTFSFISRAYSIVYWQFCEVLGMSKEIIKANEPTFRNMLGLIQGRVFYNLISWYRLVSLLPGFAWNKKFMEQMMGVKESVQLQAEELEQKGTKSRIADLFHMVGVGLKMLLYQLRLENMIADFHKHFDEVYKSCQEFDIPKRGPVELLKLYQRLERDLLWEWKAPIINDFSAMIFYGILKHFVTSWGLDATGSLQNDLLCGEAGLLSTEPMLAIMRLAEFARSDPKLRELLISRKPEDAFFAISREPKYSEFYERINDYLKNFGDRCMNELKLESPSLRENPEFLIAMVRNYIGSGAVDVKKQKEKELNIRKNAEETVRKKLGWKLTGFGFPRKLVFFWVLRNARRAVKNRENQRFARTKIYGIAREIFRRLGQHFAQEGLITSPSDIFYLNYDEIWAFIEGRSTLTNLKDLASLRKVEFDEYQKMPPPDDRFETTGIVYHKNQFKQETKATLIDEEKDIIKGIGCCKGEIVGEVKIVLSPTQDIQLKGEILVASQTDPGWVLLFPSISGLIIERGSMLSHTAIVAREMGIPTIVGAYDATRRLKNGDKVTLNGSSGIVRIHR